MGVREKTGGRKGEWLARCCLKEIKGIVKKGSKLSKWEKERKNFFEKMGRKIEEIEKEREVEEFRWEAVEEWERVEQEKDGKEYENQDLINGIKGKGVPGYLKKG